MRALTDVMDGCFMACRARPVTAHDGSSSCASLRCDDSRPGRIQLDIGKPRAESFEIATMVAVLGRDRFRNQRFIADHSNTSLRVRDVARVAREPRES
jgi:hypothetical protein